MKTRFALTIALSLLLIATSACSITAGVAPTATPMPTSTPIPTPNPEAQFNADEVPCINRLPLDWTSQRCFTLSKSLDLEGQLFYKGSKLVAIQVVYPVSESQNPSITQMFVITDAQIGGWNMDDVRMSIKATTNTGSILESLQQGSLGGVPMAIMPTSPSVSVVVFYDGINVSLLYENQ